MSQRQKDHKGHSTLSFLKIIAGFLQASVKTTKLGSSHPQFRIRTTNLKGNFCLLNYLEAYPLFSSKHLDFKDWQKVLDLFKKGEHRQKEGILKIISIKQEMNDRRTLFTWNHLNKFYNLD